MSTWTLRARQSAVLLRKNGILSLRNRRSTCIQLVSPFAFIAILFILQAGIEASISNFGDVFNVVRHQDDEPVGSIPACIKGEDLDQCFDFLFAPDTADARSIVQHICAHNVPAIDMNTKVKAFGNSEDMRSWIVENKNFTQGAYSFTFNDGSLPEDDLTKYVEYELWYNRTQYVRNQNVHNPYTYLGLPLQQAVEKAILNLTAAEPNSIQYDVGRIKFAHPELITIDVIGQNGPAFLFAATMFSFVIQLGQIVFEKEQRLREGMRTMGLRESVFWFTWLITDAIFVTLNSLILSISGLAFQFDFFTKNAFGTYFFLFLTFGLAMMSLAFVVSTFMRKTRAATTVGFFLFIIGSLFQGLSFLIYDKFPMGAQYALSLLPPVTFAKGLNDLGQLSDKDSDPGLMWKDRYDYTDDFPVGMVMEWQAGMFVVYLVLAIYLDNVLPMANDNPRKFYYFLTPSYWTGKHTTAEAPPPEQPASERRRVSWGAGDDTDVIEEEMAVRAGHEGDAAVVMKGLVKTYRGGIGKKNFTAVKGIWMRIDSGKLFCLLGPNGAGKTTTINMLTGMFGPTAGDATIFGYSITENISEVHPMMGVCPQFDILWAELTGREHLDLFARLKGLPTDEVGLEVDRLLKDVDLVEAADIRASAYSGGMRRRLSVAISLIGDPRIVVMDEPTTGMDPISRRKVWNLVERVKKDRVVLLTTHSMEEADILGDQIAIMTKGKVRCLGSSIHLKNKFGMGYSICIITKDPGETKNFFHQTFPQAMLSSELSDYLIFRVPREFQKLLPQFFRELEAVEEKLRITDIQLNLSTLEEVFIKIVEAGEEQPMILVSCGSCNTNVQVPQKSVASGVFQCPVCRQSLAITLPPA